jgi:hypothetical protein
MKRFSVLSFVGGCLVSLACVWLVAGLGAQSPPPGPDTIHVCVTDDRVMHVTPPLDACPAGQRSMFLSQAVQATASDERPLAPTDQKRLEELDKRLQQLESAEKGGELGNKVVAPFVVLNRAGKKVLEVTEGRVRIFNANEKTVATILADQFGGRFVGLSATANLNAGIGASDNRAGLIVTESDVNRLELTRTSARNYALRVLGPSGKSVAGIGESLEGGGAAYVADKNGDVKVEMRVSPERQVGRIEVVNKNGPLAVLTEEQSGKGGYFVLYNTEGTPMVDAGVHPTENIGMVRAGPAGFPVGVSLLGLPGSFVIGKKQ